MNTIFILFCAAITGAFFYRGRGGNLVDLRRPLEQTLFCIGVLFPLYAFGVNPWLILAAAIPAVAVCCTGHGQYFLQMSAEPSNRERLDFLLRPIFGIDPRQKFHDMGWDDDNITPEQRAEISQAMVFYGMRRLYLRCASGMAMTGGLISLWPGLALMTVNIPAGLLLAISGVSKAPAYMVSKWIGQGTAGGEWGYGGAQWFIATLLVILFTTVCL